MLDESFVKKNFKMIFYWKNKLRFIEISNNEIFRYIVIKYKIYFRKFHCFCCLTTKSAFFETFGLFIYLKGRNMEKFIFLRNGKKNCWLRCCLWSIYIDLTIFITHCSCLYRFWYNQKFKKKSLSILLWCFKFFYEWVFCCFHGKKRFSPKILQIFVWPILIKSMEKYLKETKVKYIL